jgi:hypothetical protein
MSKYYTFIMITSLLIKESKQYLPIYSLDLLKTYMERLKSGILIVQGFFWKIEIKCIF